MIKDSIICSKILRNSTIFVNYVIDSYGLECPNYSRSQLDPMVSARLALNCCPPHGWPGPLLWGWWDHSFQRIREALSLQSHMKARAAWDVGAASLRLPPQLRLNQQEKCNIML